MSKIFSISLVTVMMLVSLMGVAPQSGFEDISTPEVNPTIEEVPTQEVLDQDEAIQEGEQVPIDVPADVDVPIQEEQAPAPVEEPTEDANAPPADDNPVVIEEPVIVEEPVVGEEPVIEDEDPVGDEEPAELAPASKSVVPAEVDSSDDSKPATPEPKLISPNAVDPNPGDCPVDEICEGGGPSDATVSATVTGYFFDGSVYTDGPVFGATVQVNDAEGTPVDTQQTSSGSMLSFDLESGKSYMFTVSASGFHSQSKTVTVTDDGANLTFELVMLSGSATVSMMDVGSNQPVVGARITLTRLPAGSTGTRSGVSGSDGAWVAQDLQPGKYTVTYATDHYGSGTESFSLLPGQNAQVSFDLTRNTNVMVVTVIESDTRLPVTNTYLYVKNASGTQVDSGRTDSAGVYTSKELEPGRYEITAGEVGYTTVRVEVYIKSESPTITTILLDQEWKQFKIEVVDEVTGEPVEGATVSLSDPVTHKSIVTGTTQSDGRWVSPAIRNQQMHYYVGLLGYERDEGPIFEIRDDYESVKLVPLPPFVITSIVTDIVTGLPIEGAEISVTRTSDGEVLHSGQTDESGSWATEAIMPDYYTIRVTKDGYADSGTINGAERRARTINFKMYKVDHPVDVFAYMYDADTGDQIPHVKLTVRGEGINQTVISDEYGAVERLKLRPGTYVFVVEADGYEINQREETIRARGLYNLDFDMEPITKVNVSITIQAPVPVASNLMASTAAFTPSFNQVGANMQPVANASVQLRTTDTNALVGEGISNDQGVVVIAGVDEGKYELSVIVPGYEAHIQVIDLTEGTDHTITLTPVSSTTPDELETPTNPEPGDGDDDTPTIPEPGDDDVDTPVTPESPDSPVDPIPADGNDSPIAPGQDVDTVNTDDATTGEVANTDPVAVTDQSDSTEAVAQSGNTSSETDASAQSESVRMLPAAGSGPEQSQAMLSTMLLLAGVVLIIATAIRRHAR